MTPCRSNRLSGGRAHAATSHRLSATIPSRCSAHGAFRGRRRRAFRRGTTGPRRAAPRQLRREEVAQLASISVDYYTHLEQGGVAASGPVLAAVSRALRLDEDERAYLNELAGKGPACPRRRRAPTVRAPLRRILDQLSDSPALVLGRRMDVLAWNPLAAALLTDFSKIPEDRRNYVWLIFTDPQVRGALVDWERDARMTVAFLRMRASEYLDDARLSALVGELSLGDLDFRQWWATHHVFSATTGTKTFRHRVAGEITVDWELLTTDPDQQLFVMTAEPGSRSHQALRFPASWVAEREHGAESKTYRPQTGGAASWETLFLGRTLPPRRRGRGRSSRQSRTTRRS